MTGIIDFNHEIALLAQAGMYSLCESKSISKDNCGFRFEVVVGMARVIWMMTCDPKGTLLPGVIGIKDEWSFSWLNDDDDDGIIAEEDEEEEEEEEMTELGLGLESIWVSWVNGSITIVCVSEESAEIEVGIDEDDDEVNMLLLVGLVVGGL